MGGGGNNNYVSDLSLDGDPGMGRLDIAVYERGVHESRAVHLQLVATTNLILTQVKVVSKPRNWYYITMLCIQIPNIGWLLAWCRAILLFLPSFIDIEHFPIFLQPTNSLVLLGPTNGLRKVQCDVG